MEDGSSRFEEIKQRFMSELGQYFDSYGVSDIMGRIVALLIFAAKPLSLKEIAARLKLSKAAVSINIRTLKMSGLVEKITVPGDRSDYYCLDSNYGHGMFSETIKKMQDGLELLNRTLTSLQEIDKITDISHNDLEVVQNRLLAIKELYELHNHMVAELLKRWSAKKL